MYFVNANSGEITNYGKLSEMQGWLGGRGVNQRMGEGRVEGGSGSPTVVSKLGCLCLGK